MSAGKKRAVRQGDTESVSSAANERRVSTIRPLDAQNRFTSGPAIVLYIVAAKLLLHLLTVARYGIFRDGDVLPRMLAAHGLGIR